MKQVFAWGMIFVCALIFALLVDKGVKHIGIPDYFWLSINLTLFLYILYRYVGKPMGAFLDTRREGIAELVDAILAHREYLQNSGHLVRRERERAAAELETIIQQESLRRVLACTDGSQLRELVELVVQRQLDPYTASQQLLATINLLSREGQT